jgi:hypothetical protein
MAKHAGIVVGCAGPQGGNLKFIHAQEGGPVCELALSPWWQARIAAAFALPEVLRDKSLLGVGSPTGKLGSPASPE